MRSQPRAQLDAMLEQYRALTGRVSRMQADLSSLTVTARSSDGCAAATVNAWGELIGLTFDPVLARRLEPAPLGVRVVEASTAAVADARRRRDALISELLPPALRDLVGADGVAGLRRLVGEDGLLTEDPSQVGGERR